MLSLSFRRLPRTLGAARFFRQPQMQSVECEQSVFALHRTIAVAKSPFHSPMKKDVKEKRHLPAPLRDAGVVTYIQPHLIPHLILRGGIGLVALARRTFPRRYQPQLLVPTRWFHEVSGARRR